MPSVGPKQYFRLTFIYVDGVDKHSSKRTLLCVQPITVCHTFFKFPYKMTIVFFFFFKNKTNIGHPMIGEA